MHNQAVVQETLRHRRVGRPRNVKNGHQCACWPWANSSHFACNAPWPTLSCVQKFLFFYFPGFFIELRLSLACRCGFLRPRRTGAFTTEIRDYRVKRRASPRRDCHVWQPIFRAPLLLFSFVTMMSVVAAKNFCSAAFLPKRCWTLRGRYDGVRQTTRDARELLNRIARMSVHEQPTTSSVVSVITQGLDDQSVNRDDDGDCLIFITNLV